MNPGIPAGGDGREGRPENLLVMNPVDLPDAKSLAGDNTIIEKSENIVSVMFSRKHK